MAWTLQHLPSVTSLTLSGNKEYELLNPAVQLSRTEARDPDLVAQETARLEFHNFLRQISEVRVVNIDTDTTLAILKSPRMKTSARRLKFVDGRFVESGSKGLAVALQALSLEALNIDQASSIIGLDSWAPPIQLPSLTSLTVPAYRLGEAPLPLLEKLAPNLTFLRLTASHFAMNTTSPVSFPFLTHLVLEGMTKTLVLVPLFSSCPLLTLELRSRGCKFSQAHPPSRGKWPRTLRRCHFEIFSHPRPVEVESFVSDLRADGKADSYIWRPYVDAYWPGILRHFEDKAEVVEDDLRWALAEVKVLRAAGDEEGMREFSQALTRLREKRALKMS